GLCEVVYADYEIVALQQFSFLIKVLIS
ncbi:hypothetical protein L195_g044730, partial [Trifolium pratense]